MVRKEEEVAKRKGTIPHEVLVKVMNTVVSSFKVDLCLVAHVVGKEGYKIFVDFFAEVSRGSLIMGKVTIEVMGLNSLSAVKV